MNKTMIPKMKRHLDKVTNVKYEKTYNTPTKISFYFQEREGSRRFKVTKTSKMMSFFECVGDSLQKVKPSIKIKSLTL